MVRIAGPVVQPDGLDHAELEGHRHVADDHRHEDTSIGGRGRLGSDPSRSHRRWRPDHDDGFCGLQLLLDHPIELVTRDQVAVPPHPPTTSFQELGQLLGSADVLARS